MMIAVYGFASTAHAEGFTGEKFLQWERASQDSLIETSITMTGIVASQARKDIARCIDDWYTGDIAIQQQRHGYILDMIKQYPSYHPQGVILVVLQNQCGSFKDIPG